MSQNYKFWLLFVGTVFADSGYRERKYLCDKLNKTDRICVIREYDPDDTVILHIFGGFSVDVDEVQINGIKDESSTKLTSNICKRFPNLKILNAMAIQLTEIESDAFNDCGLLKALYLNENNISSLDSSIFHRNRELELIQLANNKLRTFDTNILNHLPNLKMLFLSNNQLEEFIVSDVSVHQLKNVHKIELQWNKILYLDSNDIKIKFPNLMSLTVCRSDIESFAVEMRQTFQSITFSEIHC